jgi:hypothetical protein
MKLLRDARLVRTKALPLIIATIAILLSTGDAVAEEPWLPHRQNDVELSVAASTIAIRTTGHDPYLVWQLPELVAADNRVLEFEYFCTEKIDSMSGFLGPPLSEATRFDLPDLTIAEGWQTYTVDLVMATENRIPKNANQLRIDFGMKPEIRLQIRALHLRSRTPEEIRDASQAALRRQQRMDQAQRISSYLKSSFPLKFDEITVDETSVTLVGKLANQQSATDTWRLMEYPPNESISEQGINCDESITSSRDRFRVEVPRRILGRDRLQSGWRIRETNSQSQQFLTARHFATTISPSSGQHAAERPRPKTQKGLSGISPRGPLEELPDLGIHAVTINLVLNQFLSSTAGEGRERIDVGGPPVYFDSRVFAGYDRLIDFARQHEMVVSAIVLVPRSRGTVQSPLVHTESDGGVYAMPDLSSERGTKLYAFVLDRIARRYRNTDQAPGGITNWIAHNEVDFHGVWTNMGAQPREVFTETYYCAMRMIHNAARSHNPHARVFASLTHHWIVSDEDQWKRLAPRDFLEQLQRYSNLEGDFAWGVGYHPYPQSLFAAVAWNDANIRDNFDTPLITIQNLEVLGQFLDRPEMQDKQGRMRPVLLSEQGFHTDTYDDQSQANQAGSLWYAMQKVRSLPWIESFHYHRWIDHPAEGGLMLGLRTLPSKDHPHGKRKRSWYVYQAFGTESETEATQGLPQP